MKSYYDNIVRNNKLLIEHFTRFCNHLVTKFKYDNFLNVTPVPGIKDWNSKPSLSYKKSDQYYNLSQMVTKSSEISVYNIRTWDAGIT